MKTKALLLPWLCIATAALTSSHVPVKQVNNAETGFAFVELFTSEGCSSCPPAEELMEKMVSKLGNKRVYIITYHVDYWDRLGWKDQFSSHEYSTLQYSYAEQFNLKSVYTPQVIVNGQTQFVGSNELLLRSTINSRLKGQESARIAFSAVEMKAGVCTLDYMLVGAASTAGLTFVLLQKKALIPVKSGENGGRTLTHVNIVRARKELQPGKHSGTFTISIPKDISDGNWDVLCYAKNPANGEIVTARSIHEGNTGAQDVPVK